MIANYAKQGGGRESFLFDIVPFHVRRKTADVLPVRKIVARYLPPRLPRMALDVASTVLNSVATVTIAL